MNKATIVYLNTTRDGYAPEQVLNQTITVRQLIQYLEGCDPEAAVMYRNDNGYTYGGIGGCLIAQRGYAGDDDEE